MHCHTRFSSGRKEQFAIFLMALLIWLLAEPANGQQAPAVGICPNVSRLTFTAQRFDFGETHGDCWLPASGEVSAMIICIHAVSMSSESFDNFGEAMASIGIAVYAPDLCGFGPLAGKPGRWKVKIDLNRTIQDINELLNELHERNPGKPLFLLGESMGGSFALRLAAKYPNEMNGIICSAPGWRFRKTSGIIMNVALGLMVSTKYPAKLAASGVLKQATCDLELLRRWQTNPRYRLEFSLTESLKGLLFFDNTGSYARQIKKVPVLMVQGLNDRLVMVKGTATLFSRIKSENKELVLVDNSEHLVFEEVKQRNDVTKLVADWMEEQAEKRGQNAVQGVFVGADIPSAAEKLFQAAGIGSSERDIVSDHFSGVIESAMADFGK